MAILDARPGDDRYNEEGGLDGIPGPSRARGGRRRGTVPAPVAVPGARGARRRGHAQRRRGVDRALSGEHAIVVLDVTLPDIKGFEVLRRLRVHSRMPVLMLTARGDEQDRILGLELGADDYLPKPFNPRELAARIEAILRRATPDRPVSAFAAAERIVVDDIAMDKGTRAVRQSGKELDLTTIEFNLLEEFLRAAGRVISREDLVRNVLGREFSPFDRSIDTHVSNLRKKLGATPEGVERIKGVRGVGYLYALSGLQGGTRLDAARPQDFSLVLARHRGRRRHAGGVDRGHALARQGRRDLARALRAARRPVGAAGDPDSRGRGHRRAAEIHRVVRDCPRPPQLSVRRGRARGAGTGRPAAGAEGPRGDGDRARMPSSAFSPRIGSSRRKSPAPPAGPTSSSSASRSRP